VHRLGRKSPGCSVLVGFALSSKLYLRHIITHMDKFVRQRAPQHTSISSSHSGDRGSTLSFHPFDFDVQFLFAIMIILLREFPQILL
jgi:hypothetical protein